MEQWASLLPWDRPLNAIVCLLLSALEPTRSRTSVRAVFLWDEPLCRLAVWRLVQLRLRRPVWQLEPALFHLAGRR
jgi:hypothetical protein